ncbi:hypothetical protein EV142_10656 [Flavobacterium circumlabens]|uniref:Uncharacterized protein n=1 Tax=Flavobacterium circumlabens TaxID=2133765 RepID=A0ABY2AWI3_9FLAO|nr:hypothetical protein EV142_10656 [Flavobacterium circumlabens]
MYKINSLKILIVGLTTVLNFTSFSENYLKEEKVQKERPNLSFYKD